MIELFTNQGVILIDSSQAAVTLTNHLLEKSLKAVLMHNEPSNQNYTDAAEIEQHFENMNNQFGSIVLHKTITACHEKILLVTSKPKNCMSSEKNFVTLLVMQTQKKYLVRQKK